MPVATRSSRSNNCRDFGSATDAGMTRKRRWLCFCWKRLPATNADRTCRAAMFHTLTILIRASYDRSNTFRGLLEWSNGAPFA